LARSGPHFETTLVVLENTLSTASEIPGAEAAIKRAINTSMMAYSMVVTPAWLLFVLDVFFVSSFLVFEISFLQSLPEILFGRLRQPGSTHRAFATMLTFRQLPSFHQ